MLLAGGVGSQISHRLDAQQQQDDDIDFDFDSDANRQQINVQFINVAASCKRHAQRPAA